MTSNDRIKMTDFGFARITAAETDVKNMTYCGTDVRLVSHMVSMEIVLMAPVVHEPGDDEWRAIRFTDRCIYAWYRFCRDLREASCRSSDLPGEYTHYQSMAH